MKKSTTRISAVLLSIAGIGCVVLLAVLSFTLRADASAVSQRPLPGTTFLRTSQAVGLPVRLRIPGIKVDASIESVGLTDKGAMDIPKDHHNVGWYNLGAKPGEIGSAVLAGHLDWYNGETAVFEHLDDLRIGDVLSVETDKGRFIQFVVREIRNYKPTEYVPAIFQNNDGAHLNLVTCGGVWDTARKIYSERLVIFTDAVDPTLPLMQ